MSRERLYILYRKLKAWGNRLCFLLCSVLPVDRHLVAVCTFEGRGGFGCNPKYLVQELHRRDPSLRFIWLVDDLSKPFPSYIRKAPNTTWSRAYHLSRAKVWLGNYRTRYGTWKTGGHYYLNLNHYTMGIKCTGLLRGSGFSPMAELVSRSDSRQMDALVIDSDWCKRVMPQAMLFEGELLETGSPRCDILYGDRGEPRRKLRERHGLPQDAKVVLYAPTFREGAKDGRRHVFSEVWTLDFRRLLDTLAERFGGRWYLCTRVHPQLAPSFKSSEAMKGRGDMFDESKADDMYEILAGVDAYITDYSSAVFEAMLTRLPVFLYADDVKEYTRDRGALYWKLDGGDRRAIANDETITPGLSLPLPFPLSRSNDELMQDIRDYDEAAYRQKVDCFAEKIGLVFDGKASKRLADMIEGRIG